MKRKFLRRVGMLAAAAVMTTSALVMFAGCTSTHPEVTITYSFNGEDYEVDYVLSRTDAPRTVQHFIELADAGYYDGMCIHDFTDVYIYGGGYTLSEDGTLVEKDYWTEVKALEQEKDITFTQSVWQDAARTIPLYTVYGEFEENGVRMESGFAREYTHRAGALVMYYTPKINFDGDVTVQRNDNGDNNDGEKYEQKSYRYNSATSFFYTFTGESNTENDRNYCVFGMAKNYTEQMTNGLLAAIDDYEAEREDDEEFSFTEETTVKPNRYDPFEDVRTNGDEVTYHVPVEPIIIRSVRVTKY